MSATLSSLAAFLVPIALDFFLKWLKSGQSDEALRKEGAREANDAANKESTDAQNRMAQSNAEHRSPDLVDGRLRNGTF